jgi:NADPH-dependent ferric siderophore reductase
MADGARFPQRTGIASLVSRTSLSPGMLRLPLRGDGFRADWPGRQPGEIVTLLFTAPDDPVVLPLAGWRFPAGAPEQPWRNYTVRRHRPAAGESDIDVVLHEPPGPACTWAARAAIGAEVGYAGPRVDFAPCHDAGWLLLCGDETALPAIAAILEAAPRDRPVVAVVEVADAAAQLPIDVPPRGGVHWVHRDGAPAATTATSPTRCAASRGPRARARPGARRSPGWPARSARCCTRSAGCRAATPAPAATGCARATGSTTRADPPPAR